MTTLVGLTGNIASGKSTVAALFAAKGATVIDADALAHVAVERGTPALAAIAARWPSVMQPDGSLDRAALRQIVFANDVARNELNAIVHPAVAVLRDRALAAARAQGSRVVIYDVPLLFEAGLERDVDVIVLVDAPEGARRVRLVRDRGLSESDARAMIAAQMPSGSKRARAHYVIDNEADGAALQLQVDAIWNALAPPSAPG